jgi:type VI secretion system secreted protein VgrG
MPYDIDAAVKYLVKNAGGSSTGRCATYVREAMEAGGLDLTSRPLSAKDYGPYLQARGFTRLSQTAYQPTKGDVVVIQNYKGGDIHGHIAMYDGTRWISDFVQRDFWGGPGYRTKTPPYAVYRP